MIAFTKNQSDYSSPIYNSDSYTAFKYDVLQAFLGICINITEIKCFELI